MLLIQYPNQSTPEIRYILSVIFDDFLELPFQAQANKNKNFEISYEGQKLTVASDFFLALAENNTKNLINGIPLDIWDSTQAGMNLNLTDPLVPVLFGEPVFNKNKKHIHIGIDIFGAAFFMLSRIEETLNTNLDEHARFPVTEAMAYKNGFLLRPIIDEYVEILWAAIQQLWPSLKRKERHYQIVPTHDVDTPFLGKTLNVHQFIRHTAGDLIRRKNPLLAIKTGASFLHANLSNKYPPSFDPYNMHDWFMDQSEKAGVKSRFYFMASKEPDNFYGGRYNIDEVHIIQLMKNIANRGHEIGLHPTAESFVESGLIKIQADKLRQAMATNNIKQKQLGGRQHYLRWQADKTPALWQEASLDYDSTLGHAEHVGFRCGTCHAFPMWDFKGRKALNVRQHPLILMDCSLLADNYMGLEKAEALVIIEQLKGAVKKYNGNFVFLWHNSYLLSKADKEIYRSCIS